MKIVAKWIRVGPFVSCDRQQSIALHIHFDLCVLLIHTFNQLTHDVFVCNFLSCACKRQAQHQQ